mmetsp:Transcript_24189/g.52647  ORF Transcript_24189/g.52647 Transcript_24189/m.52647 type:complete len:209 (-) Transcript_24189:14-640(-)
MLGNELGQLTAFHQLHNHHFVLGLGGSGSISIEAADALGNVGVTLDLLQDIHLLLYLSDLFLTGWIHREPPNWDCLHRVLGGGATLLVALVNSALPTNSQDLVRFDHEGVLRRPELFELLDGSHSPPGRSPHCPPPAVSSCHCCASQRREGCGPSQPRGPREEGRTVAGGPRSPKSPRDFRRRGRRLGPRAHFRWKIRVLESRGRGGR